MILFHVPCSLDTQQTVHVLYALSELNGLQRLLVYISLHIYSIGIYCNTRGCLIGFKSTEEISLIAGLLPTVRKYRYLSILKMP